MQTGLVVSFIITALLGLFTLYLFIHGMNLSKQVSQLADFVHGDVFSDRFHHMLSNYFSDENNTRCLTDPMTPLVADLVARLNRTNQNTDEQAKEMLEEVSQDLYMFF